MTDSEPAIAPPRMSRRSRVIRIALPAEPRFILLLAGAGSVVLVAVLAIWSIVAGQRDDGEAERATRIREHARRLVMDLFTVENQQRGYLLTGDRADLDGWRDARDDAERQMISLREQPTITLSVPIAALSGTVATELAEVSSTIRLAEAGERPAALAAVRHGAGRRAMASSMAAIEDIIATLTVIEQAHEAQVKRAARTTSTVIVVGSGVAVLALMVGITSIRRRSQERVRAIAEIRDQTDEAERRRIALSQALHQLSLVNQALVRSNRDLDQFAYVASHDLKAPLRGIASLASWIEEDLGDRLDAKIAEHLRLLQTRVERLELLIDGILAYSRAGRNGAAADTVDVGRLVTKVVELVAPPAEVQLVVDPSGWPTITTVAVQLEQVWMNLIGNAIKHGRKPDGSGKIVVAAIGNEDSAWHFTVADEGPGIAPEFRDRIFEMFQRLQSRDQVEGAGIGLAVVRKLVTAHGGKVWVDVPPSGGTTMHFTWGGRS